AYSASARVLCFAGQISRAELGRGFGAVHEIPDQLAIIAQLTKWAQRANTPEEAAVKTALACRAVRSGFARPVGLEIPTDVLAASGSFAAHRPFPAEAEPMTDENRTEEAATLLAQAERPLIVVGAGAQDAPEEIRALAELLQAPVIAHRMGRGVMDSRHPLSQDMPAGHRLWRKCDVVLAVGTRLLTQRQGWGTDDKLKIIHIDLDPVRLSLGSKVDIPLIGAAKSLVAKLGEQVDRLSPLRASRTEEMLALKADVARELSVLEPQLSFLAALRAALPEDGIYVDEITQLGYVARLTFPVYRPRSYLSPGYQGTLGWGFATALGAKDACPDRPVLSVNGDGGFLFAQPELATAVRHRIPLVSVVFNDSAYGNVRRMQQELYGNRIVASELTNPDFVALGESFGVSSCRVERPDQLRRAVETAFAANEPTLIEVPCGVMPNPSRFQNLPKVRGPGVTA
ncbi:MAG: thiamine pyrophosphate-dependent enzyme, partial [Pseudomonadota bacterium]